MFAFVVEGWALLVAVRAINEARGDIPMLEHLRSTPDPMTAAVLLEDGAAVCGVVIAAVCIGLSSVFENPAYDAVGSILIGLMMGVMAVLLVNRNRELLLGEAPRPEIVERIAAVVSRQPEVESIHDVKAEVLGGGRIRFKAEIDFDAEEITRRELEKIDMQQVLDGIGSADELREAMSEFGQSVVEAMGEAVDRIEERASAEVPELAHMDLEAD